MVHSIISGTSNTAEVFMSSPCLKNPRQDRAGSPKGLRDMIGYHLKRASARDLLGANASLADLGLRTVAVSVLLTIAEQPGISAAEICRVLRLQRANIVPILMELELRQLFLRETDPDDNRIQRLFPTARGLEEVQAVLDRLKTHEDNLLAALSPAERDELRRMLALIWREDG
jgi:DNA-binding MarR family transcriptional regulator